MTIENDEVGTYFVRKEQPGFSHPAYMTFIGQSKTEITSGLEGTEDTDWDFITEEEFNTETAAIQAARDAARG